MAELKKRRPNYEYVWKSFKWMLGNAFFGLIPLLLLFAFYKQSNGAACGDAVNRLIHDGIILFVCIAMVGAVYVDFYLSEFVIKGMMRFTVYFFPLFMPIMVGVNFVLITFDKINHTVFDINSNTTIYTVVSSLAYVLLVKTNLYIKEDTVHESTTT